MGKQDAGSTATPTDDPVAKQVEALASQVATLTETVTKVARVKGVSKGLDGSEGTDKREAGIWDGVLFGRAG